MISPEDLTIEIFNKLRENMELDLFLSTESFIEILDFLRKEIGEEDILDYIGVEKCMDHFNLKPRGDE